MHFPPVAPEGFAPGLDAFLLPLDDAQGPAGPSLRYDPVYARIRDARSEDDASLPMGEWTRTLKKADWRAAEILCTEVLQQRSKDLQVALWLTEAWVHLHALDGLAAGARLLEALARNFWDSAHPRIEDGDAEVRAATFVWANDTLAQALLLHVPLVPWPASAQPFINLCDWQRAVTTEFGTGAARARATASDDESTAPGISRQDILDQAGHHLRALTALDERFTRACAAWASLEALLDERLGADAPSLSKVTDMLARLRQAVRSLLQGRDPRDQEQAAARAEPPADAFAYASPLSSTPVHDPMNEEPPDSSSQALPQAVASSRIGSRAEAYRLLELAAAYLQREEPHSPTPYLVNRAVTWGRMPLPELMREVLREEGDLNRYFSMLGIEAEPDRTP
ncbi:type VI secretion system protein TssA [Variovorax sp. GB1P17]